MQQAQKNKVKQKMSGWQKSSTATAGSSATGFNNSVYASNRGSERTASDRGGNFFGKNKSRVPNIPTAKLPNYAK